MVIFSQIFTNINREIYGIYLFLPSFPLFLMTFLCRSSVFCLWRFLRFFSDFRIYNFITTCLVVVLLKIHDLLNGMLPRLCVFPRFWDILQMLPFLCCWDVDKKYFQFYLKFPTFPFMLFISLFSMLCSGQFLQVYFPVAKSLFIGL